MGIRSFEEFLFVPLSFKVDKSNVFWLGLQLGSWGSWGWVLWFDISFNWWHLRKWTYFFALLVLLSVFWLSYLLGRWVLESMLKSYLHWEGEWYLSPWRKCWCVPTSRRALTSLDNYSCLHVPFWGMIVETLIGQQLQRTLGKADYIIGFKSDFNSGTTLVVLVGDCETKMELMHPSKHSLISQQPSIPFWTGFRCWELEILFYKMAGWC